MSMNLNFGMRDKHGRFLERIDLIQTPTRVTYNILGKTNVRGFSLEPHEEVLKRYISWVEDQAKRYGWDDPHPVEDYEDDIGSFSYEKDPIYIQELNKIKKDPIYIQELNKIKTAISKHKRGIPTWYVM